LLIQCVENDRKSVCSETINIARLLLAYWIVSSYGLHAETLGRIAVEKAAQMQMPKSPSAVPVFLLHRLGLLASVPPAGTLTLADIGGDSLALLLAKEEGLRWVCERIASASLCGTTMISGLSEALRCLSLTLPSLALQRLRIYDLELGGALLRSIAYAGLEQSVFVKSGLRFLEAQQRGEGSFGYFAFEFACSDHALNNLAVFRAQLSATVNCLWTIAELRMTDFRLGVSPFS
jgi:hypothetical protein